MSITPSQNELEQLKELPDRQCQNCDFIYDGYYCPRCGQRFMQGRFELKESAGWVLGQIFNMEKGFFHTIWCLLLNPGMVIDNYLHKATIRYMHPFRFVFIIASISALVTILSGAFETTDLSQFAIDQSEEGIERMQQTIDFIKKYLTLVMVISIPFYSIGSYLFYRKRKKNYTEHLIVNSYAYGLSLVVSLPFTLLIVLPNGLVLNSTISTIASFLTFAYVYSRLFKENFFLAVLKTIFITVLAVVIGMTIGVIGGIAAVLISSIFN
jgi:hypothetical protein